MGQLTSSPWMFTNKTNKKINLDLLKTKTQVRLLIREVNLTPLGSPHYAIERNSQVTLAELRQCWV